jgi:hypothetical protein
VAAHTAAPRLAHRDSLEVLAAELLRAAVREQWGPGHWQAIPMENREYWASALEKDATTIVKQFLAEFPFPQKTKKSQYWLSLD